MEASVAKHNNNNNGNKQPLVQQQQQQEFALVSVTELASSSSPPSSPSSPVTARFGADNGVAELRFHRDSKSTGAAAIVVELQDAQLIKLGPVQSICISDCSSSDTVKEKYSRGVTIQFRNEEESKTFHCSFQQWKKQGIVQGASLPNGVIEPTKSKFDDKIESSSAKMYFHYYGQLLHQQNMLQDYVRTGTYYAAVIENRADFIGRVVVDVGAGSGILSLFAAQAGAKHVYAVEASEMAEYARKLIAGNPSLGDRITVIKGKVEDVELPEKADILISEPMGTLLVNERMLESYVIARDRFLTPNGKMFPTVGRIHMAPFSDEYLFIEIANKSLFWQQRNYYGVDLTPLYNSAFQGYFTQPVVDAFDPRVLVAPAIFHVINFTEIKEEDLYEIDIPLKFIASVGARVHGLACCTVQRWLTTAPGAPTTHWYQLRCVLSQPLYVMAGQEITGRLRMVAHNAQSYTIYLTLSVKMWGPGAEQGGILQTESCKLDLKEPYYRMSQPQAYTMAQDQQPHQSIHSQDINIQADDLEEPELIQHLSQNLDAQLQ
ncbi:putative histone-arginine methyltransferase 1.3 [Turnera subulata]|uniref:type I protein arginine methyltransferase n=1 Tax=Turnera subulata TaxID=218843 RepID=A0A9Q0FM51_9ROSI|nr:putative histone-arginine methyltransferase 1.3 [Turnera subulata]